MIIGIVNKGSIRGNGITCAFSYLLYQEYLNNKREIVTNFHTNFTQFSSIQNLFDNWFDEKQCGKVIGLLNLESALLTRDQKVLIYLEKCLNHRRMCNYDIIYQSDNWNKLPKNIRDQTDYIMHSDRWHMKPQKNTKKWKATEKCLKNGCKEKHKVLIYQDIPKESLMKMIKPKFIVDEEEFLKINEVKETIVEPLNFNPAWEKRS